MSDAPYLLNLRLKLIQQWRMVQALAEGDHFFSLPEEQAANLEFLQTHMPVRLGIGGGKAAPATLMALSTLDPWCEIAGIRRTLIYPHQILAHCRGLAQTNRTVRFGFAGFDHKGRDQTLQAWHQKWFGTTVEPKRLRTSDDMAIYGGPNALSAEVAIIYSKAGRSFPAKVWDSPYFDFLANCTYTLCPNGEEVWTYRFFEAMLCGSIPVVESDCPVYKGFHYGFLDDDPDKLDCSKEAIEHNYAHCQERLSIPIHLLNDAVGRLLRGE